MRRSVALFEDPYTDTRMRRTIPRYARLGAAAVAITAPITGHTTQQRLVLGGIVVVAFIAAQVFSWRNLIDRIPRGLLLGQLHFYCVLIALGASVGGGIHSPYRLLYFLPVTFTAVFFTGWLRFSTAIVASGIDTAVLRIAAGVSLPEQAVRCVMVLLVANFASEVAEMLRESLRDNRSLHAVLEAASGDPLNSELASIGLEAAMSVVRWDAGGVVLVENGFLNISVVRGVSNNLLPFYEEHPVAIADAALVGPIATTGKPFAIDDMSTMFPPEHPLRAEGLAALAGVPINYHGEVVGVLVVGSFKPRHADEHDLDRLHRVAGQLGLALGNARAYRVEKEVAEHLRELNHRKDEFLANVSHELRTPATAIKLVASTLRHNASRLDPAQIDELYETIERRSTGSSTASTRSKAGRRATPVASALASRSRSTSSTRTAARSRSGAESVKARHSPSSFLGNRRRPWE